MLSFSWTTECSSASRVRLESSGTWHHVVAEGKGDRPNGAVLVAVIGIAGDGARRWTSRIPRGGVASDTISYRTEQEVKTKPHSADTVDVPEIPLDVVFGNQARLRVEKADGGGKRTRGNLVELVLLDDEAASEDGAASGDNDSVDGSTDEILLNGPVPGDRRHRGIDEYPGASSGGTGYDIVPDDEGFRAFQV